LKPPSIATPAAERTCSAVRLLRHSGPPDAPLYSMKPLFLTSTLLCAGFSVLLLASVKTDYDHSANFNSYHTYSWINVKAGDSLWVDRIKSDVDQQLTAKGWSKSGSGGDVGVTAFGSTRNQQTLDTFYDSIGGGWRWRGFGGDGIATTTVENTPIGTLTVDLFDNNTRKLLWRATSTETLSDKPDKNDKKLEKAVADMFKKFPPDSKSY